MSILLGPDVRTGHRMTLGRGAHHLESTAQPPGTAQNGRVTAWSLRTHFVVFGAVLILPLAILAAALVWMLADAGRREVEQRMIQVSAGLAADVDRELQRRLTVLQTLAHSPALRRGDLASFHSHARAALQHDKAGIFLIEAGSLQQLVNTYTEFGAPLPGYGSPETAQKVLETGFWQVSNLFIGRVSKRPAFDVVQPIDDGGRIRYLLAIGLEPFMFLDILRGQNLPPPWVLLIVDRNGAILARSADQDRYVGTKVPLAFTGERKGAIERFRDIDGELREAAIAESALSGWRVIVTLPVAMVTGPLNRSVIFLALWCATALLLTAVLAGWFARMVAAPISLAARAAAGLVRGRPVNPAKSRVSEANHLVDSLKQAELDLATAEEKRRTAEAQQQAAYLDLDSEKTRQSALHQFVGRLHQSASMSEVYQAALEAILEALRCDRASILIRDDEGTMKFVAWDGLSALYRKAVEGHSPWSSEDPNPQPICITDIDQADIDDKLKDVVKREGIGALAFIPLVADGKLVGKFMTYHNRAHVYDTQEQALSLAIARQVALSIERLRTDTALRDNEARMAAMLQQMPFGAGLMDRDGRWIVANDLLRKTAPLVAPSRDPDRSSRWRALDENGHAIEPTNWPSSRALRGETVSPGIDFTYTDDDGRELSMRVAAAPFRNTVGEITGAVAVVQDITTMKSTEDALRDNEARKSAVLNSALDAIISMDQFGRIVEFNPAAEQLFGYRREDVAGKPVADCIIPPRFRDAHRRGLAEYLRSGHGPVLGKRIEMPALRSDGSEFESEISISTARLGTGEVVFTAYLRDITERRRAAETEKVLVRELQHRTGNILAVIQAIAHRSLSGNGSLTEARAVFEARLQALARTHRELLKSNWSGMVLRDLICAELEPFAAQTQIEGPAVILPPQDAQNFSLVIHELATNASKYGALSQPRGTVDVRWSLGGSGKTLQFRWQERGGPAVVVPQRHGFGTSLINAIFKQAIFDYAEEGLTCSIDLQLADEASARIGSSSSPAMPHGSPQPAPDAVNGQRSAIA
jgi:PAS domain S-box-containing protein